jgi:hypothetical protein
MVASLVAAAVLVLAVSDRCQEELDGTGCRRKRRRSALTGPAGVTASWEEVTASELRLSLVRFDPFRSSFFRAMVSRQCQ